MGESFGAVLALSMSISEPQYISKLVLINPATSYHQSIWPLLGPLLTRSGPFFPIFTSLALLLTAIHPHQIIRLAGNIASEVDSVDTARKKLKNTIASGGKLLSALQRDTLLHKLKTLADGSSLVQARFSLSIYLHLPMYLSKSMYLSMYVSLHLFDTIKRKIVVLVYSFLYNSNNFL